MLLLLMGYGGPVVVVPNVGIVRSWTLQERDTSFTLDDRGLSWTVEER